ncbi:MAG: hypothetical protein ACRDUW_04375 [Pseudonocardiaceae bacterium]
MRSEPFAAPDRSDFTEALHSSGPAPELAADLHLFGQFIGSWHLECSVEDPGGQPTVMEGELHFGWVLGGRAVQDVWIVPGRGHPKEGDAPGFHGTAIRFYAPTINAWRSTWIDPPNNRVRRFIGRPSGSDIELISDEQTPFLRWRFTDITPRSFTWTGERSTEDPPR